MKIFTLEEFNSGRWTGPLAKALSGRLAFLDKDRHPRLWRGETPWKQWIQFEPVGFSGPAYWIGKPAIVSWDNMLYVGHYIERGRPEGYHAQQGYTGLRLEAKRQFEITPGWHWHLFMATLANPAQSHRLNQLMETLPAARRCVWFLYNSQQPDRIPYEGEVSLQQMRDRINSCSRDDYIDLVMGVSFSAQECVDLQEAIVQELREPLKRAHDIDQTHIATAVADDLIPRTEVKVKTPTSEGHGFRFADQRSTMIA